jgi:nucleoside 2-deoxyribosyltransferase
LVFKALFTCIVLEESWMKVFLASPLFNESERQFNSQIAKRLRENGFDVWLAQEAMSMDTESHRDKETIYKHDISALETSDIVLAILDGIDVDAGVSFEMGYAKALGRRIIGLKTDYRTFSRTDEVNLMLEVSVYRICASVDEAVNLLARALQESK